jgi:hypothetical protein
MELAKCARCGKLFNQVKLPVCPPCELEEEKEILTVQVYMRDHTGESLEEVSNALNIYLEDIERWIGERRLTVTNLEGTAIKCFICEVPIVTGRVCLRCSERLGMPPPEPERPKTPRNDSIPNLRDRDGGNSVAAQKYRQE